MNHGPATLGGPKWYDTESNYIKAGERGLDLQHLPLNWLQRYVSHAIDQQCLTSSYSCNCLLPLDRSLSCPFMSCPLCTQCNPSQCGNWMKLATLSTVQFSDVSDQVFKWTKPNTNSDYNLRPEPEHDVQNKWYFFLPELESSLSAHDQRFHLRL